jgi:hypothetical protein
MEEGEAEPGEMPRLKRPNPIARQTPPKKQRVGDVSDASPNDTPERQAGSTSASRANSTRQPPPSPAKGVAYRPLRTIVPHGHGSALSVLAPSIKGAACLAPI